MTTFTLTTTQPLTSTPSAQPGLINGTPLLLLRAEGFVMLALASAGYRALGGTWGLFAACFFLPDLSLLGYLAGPRIGALVYNSGHSLMGPALLAAVGVGSAGWASPAVLAALIWAAHIGFDRMAGYGLKYGTSFFDTHLGRVGKAKSNG